MVFSSFPTYIDSFNQEQQQLQQEITDTSHHGSSSNSPLLPRPRPPPANTTRPTGPWSGIQCPRCQSTNTKFCYYNNRSFSQPRYLCKNCRRHWTYGGTLRKIPVGGVRRKNKHPKSPATSPSVASSALISNTNVHHDFGGSAPGTLGLTTNTTNYSINGSDIRFQMGSTNNDDFVMPDIRFPFVGGSLYEPEELLDFEFGTSSAQMDGSVGGYEVYINDF